MLKGYSNQTFDEYYIDLESENESFLKMALLLEAKGIENYSFFLKLYNKKLRGVDPYAELKGGKLTTEQKFMIFKECADNRWYFFREVFRVAENGASTDIGGGVPFALNRGNLAGLWATELNISVFLIMPRQFGKTWFAIADSVHTHQFIKNSQIIHFNKSQTDSNDNLTRIRTAIGMLPEYLQHSNEDNLDSKDKRKIKNNEKSMRNILDSSIVAMASAGNEAKADAMARGKTASKIWFDEIGFTFFNKAIYEAATPAYEKAAANAIKNGVPYGITITTTPGDLATPHGEYAYKFMNECIRFDENMYNMKAKKLYDIVLNTPDKRQFLFIQFHYWQLGQDDDWYAEVAKRLGDPIRARREYLLEWINTNGNSPFDADDVEVIMDLANDKAEQYDLITINKYFKMKVYEEYHGKKPVIISVDVSSGIGRDSSAVVVINPETLKPIAVFTSNMITSVHLKRFLIKLVTKFYQNCILTIENNSIGTSLINELRETPISRVLYKERKKKKIETGVNSFTKSKTVDTVVYGHNVNSDSKPKMLEMLESMVKYSKTHLALPELVEEIRFMELRNGKIVHSSATHDDATMAYLGGLYIVRYGTGLKGRGIYFTLAESDEDIVFDSDIDARLKKIDKFIAKDETEEDIILRNLSEEIDIETSHTLMEKQRKEVMMQYDKIDDYEEEESPVMRLTDNMQNMILRNYKSILDTENEESFADHYKF